MSGKILILGKGFIGTHLARGLRAAGHKVKAVASAQCDLRDSEGVEETLGGLGVKDTLILAAAKTRVGGESRTVYTDNVAIARSVAQFLHNNRLRQLIFLSTADVYGPPRDERPLREATALNPIGAYAQSKAVSETLLQHACSPYGTPLTVLRFPGVYGPGDRGLSTVSHMARDATRSGQITLVGDCSLRRDYLFVGDLVATVELAVGNPRHTVVNVASGHSHSVNEIAETIAKAVPREASIVRTPRTDATRGFNLSFDLRRFRALFPDLELTSLETGIAQIVG